MMTRFIKGGMNIIDLLGILPYFMSLLLSLITVSGKLELQTNLHKINMFSVVSVMGTAGDGEAFGQYEMRRIAQIFRIMRILRCVPVLLSIIVYYLPPLLGSSSWPDTSLVSKHWA